jgi:hypothetical protein
VTAVGGSESAAGVDSTMTNGNVATTTTKGGEQNILVPPTAPIVAFVPGDASIVKLGADPAQIPNARATKNSRNHGVNGMRELLQCLTESTPWSSSRLFSQRSLLV